MNGVWKVTRLTLAASVACVGWVAAHAQAVGQKEIAGIDKRYAIASERVGEDEEEECHLRNHPEHPVRQPRNGGQPTTEEEQ